MIHASSMNNAKRSTFKQFVAITDASVVSICHRLSIRMERLNALVSIELNYRNENKTHSGELVGFAFVFANKRSVRLSHNRKLVIQLTLLVQGNGNWKQFQRKCFTRRR